MIFSSLNSYVWFELFVILKHVFWLFRCSKVWMLLKPPFCQQLQNGNYWKWYKKKIHSWSQWPALPWVLTTPPTRILCGDPVVLLASGCVSSPWFGKTAVWISAMSVQVVAAKMAEVELKDVPKKDLPVVSPVTPKTDEKGSLNNEAHVSATSPMSEPGVRSDPSPVSPNPLKMPQASAMKRPDPQQNGGEAFVNSDGTVAEAPRMKKVTKAD